MGQVQVKRRRGVGNASATLVAKVVIFVVIALEELKHQDALKPGNVSTIVNPKDLSERQLEQLLAEKRLHREESLLPAEPSSTNVVNAASQHAMTLLEIEVNIESVKIDALLDTGAQSTIISRSALHSI